MSQQSDVLKAYVTRFDPEPLNENDPKEKEKAESNSEVREEESAESLQ